MSSSGFSFFQNRTAATTPIKDGDFENFENEIESFDDFEEFGDSGNDDFFEEKKEEEIPSTNTATESMGPPAPRPPTFSQGLNKSAPVDLKIRKSTDAVSLPVFLESTPAPAALVRTEAKQASKEPTTVPGVSTKTPENCKLVKPATNITPTPRPSRQQTLLAKISGPNPMAFIPDQLRKSEVPSQSFSDVLTLAAEKPSAPPREFVPESPAIEQVAASLSVAGLGLGTVQDKDTPPDTESSPTSGDDFDRVFDRVKSQCQDATDIAQSIEEICLNLGSLVEDATMESLKHLIALQEMDAEYDEDFRGFESAKRNFLG